MRDIVGNNVTIVPSPADVPEPIVKVAAYNPAGADVLRDMFDARWRGVFRTAVSGDCWFDFNSTDQGRRPPPPVRHSRRRYRRHPRRRRQLETTPPMLDAAGAPYIMSTASPVLRRKYPNSCANVEDILRGIG